MVQEYTSEQLATNSWVKLSDVTDIYRNYEPAVDNLYTVELYNLSNSNDTMNDYIKFHATNINFANESLKLSRNPATRRFCIGDSGDYTLQDTLTVTWRESSDFAVKRYHEEWLGCFYDRATDCFKSCSTQDEINKLRRVIVITLPKSSNGITPKFQFIVLPNIRPGVQLGWKDTGGIIKDNMTYYVEREVSEYEPS